MNINIRLIEKSISQKRLSDMAVFCKLKSLYKNSCIFSASYKNLAAKSGISESKLRESIPFLLKNGWVRRHGDNIVLSPLGNFDDNRKKRRMVFVPVNRKDNYKNIQKYLKVALLKAVHDGFIYIQKQSCDVKEGARISKKEYNRKKKIRPISESSRFSMANSKIGGLIERSRSTGSRLVSWAKKNGIVQTAEHVVEVKDPKGVFLDGDVPRNYFIDKKGRTMKRMANFISFL